MNWFTWGICRFSLYVILCFPSLTGFTQCDKSLGPSMLLKMTFSFIRFNGWVDCCVLMDNFLVISLLMDSLVLLCPSREISQWPPGSRYQMQKQESFYYQARAGAPTRYRRSGYREEPWVLGYIAYIGYSRARNLKNGSFWVGRHLIGYLLWKG